MLLRHSKKVIIFIFFFNTSIINAVVYDNDTLDIFSKILPRIVLMSTQKEKITDEIKICVLHDNVDEEVALSLIEKVNINYPDGIKDYKIKLVNGNYKNLEVCSESQLSFMFNSSENNIYKALKFSSKNKILSMSYDAKLLKNGVHSSLFIGRKITPYINLDRIKTDDIQLNNILLRVSKIYTGDNK